MPEQILDDSIGAAARAIESLLGGSKERESQPEPEPAETNEPAAAEAEARAEEEPTETEPEDGEVSDNEIDETPAEEAASEPEPEGTKTEPEKAKEPEPKARVVEVPRETNVARDQTLDQLNTVIAQFQASLRGEFADIKSEDDQIALAEKDPDRYNRYVIAQMKLQRAVKAQNELATQRMRDWQTAEKVKLHGLLPDLKDPESEKAKTLAADIIGYAKKQGYTDQQLTLAGANDIHTIYKAMLWERGEAQRQATKETEAKKLEEAKKKAAGAPPVQRPGAGKPQSGVGDKVKDDVKRLQKSGHLKDVAAVFEHIL